VDLPCTGIAWSDLNCTVVVARLNMGNVRSNYPAFPTKEDIFNMTKEVKAVSHRCHVHYTCVLTGSRATIICISCSGICPPVRHYPLCVEFFLQLLYRSSCCTAVPLQLGAAYNQRRGGIRHVVGIAAVPHLLLSCATKLFSRNSNDCCLSKHII
jgi:hypothetical protein